MAGFCRVHKHGCGAGRRQRCRYFSANVAAFAHACDHHPPCRAQDGVHRLYQCGPHLRLQPQQGISLDLQRVECSLQNFGGVVMGPCWAWRLGLRHEFIL